MREHSGPYPRKSNLKATPLPLPPAGLREHRDPRDDHPTPVPRNSRVLRDQAPEAFGPTTPSNGNRWCPEASLTLLRSLSMSLRTPGNWHDPC